MVRTRKDVLMVTLADCNLLLISALILPNPSTFGVCRIKPESIVRLFRLFANKPRIRDGFLGAKAGTNDNALAKRLKYTELSCFFTPHFLSSTLAPNQKAVELAPSTSRFQVFLFCGLVRGIRMLVKFPQSA